MPASRIFRFARTRRCAIVASGTRNARAISSVSRPPSERSVSASRASSASAGWQHAKMRLSRSSGIVVESSISSSVGAVSRRPSSSVLRRRVCSRRSRSIARFRATVTSQPAGFAGTPSRGQRSTAIETASWRASSARSKSPRTPIRVASTRPWCSRNSAATGSTGPALPWERAAAPRSCRRVPTGSSPPTRSRRRANRPRSGRSRRAAPSSRRTVRP